MKLGTETKTKTILAGVLAVLAIVLVVRAFTGGGQDNAPAQSTANTPKRPAGQAKKSGHPLLAHSLDPTLRFDLLKSSEEVTYKGNGRNIFRSEAPAPEIPKPIEQAMKQAPPTPPPPPPIDLKFYGYAGPKGGSRQIFLLKGEDIFLAREGQIVDRRYKILHIGPSSVEIQDVLTNNTQTIPLSAG